MICRRCNKETLARNELYPSCNKIINDADNAPNVVSIIKSKVIAGFIGIVALVCLGCVACGSTSEHGGQKEAETTAEIAANTPESEAAPNMDGYINDLTVMLEEGFGKNYNVKSEGNLITMNVWSDGVAKGATSAKVDATVKAVWDGALTDNIRSLNKGAYELAITEGYPNAIVVTNVVSDLDKTTGLLGFKNGELLYDVVNGIDKR